MSQDNKKSALRKTLLERRDGLSYEIMVANERQIRRHLHRIPSYVQADTIGCYYSMESEVPTREIILDVRSAGSHVCLPRVREASLEFAIVSSPSDLVEGKFGIMEPSMECETCVAPDIVLVPTVGISHDGARLGRGGGHYDRFLAGYGGVSVALAFSVQVVRRIPEQDWDMRVSWIVTEDGTVRA